MLNWSNQFNICCFLDNHKYPSANHSIEVLAGVGTSKIFYPENDFFSSLSAFVQQAEDYIFGHFNYEIKDKIAESAPSALPDFTDFPDHFLYVAEVVLSLENDVLKIGVLDADPQIIFKEIISSVIGEGANQPVKIKARQSREQYIDAVKQLQQHIQFGDCYVINYCQEFYGTAKINPVCLYQHLSEISPNPFGAFYKLKDHYLLCGSPERFIKKQGNRIISQPIKGTSPRNHSDKILDQKNFDQLYQSRKDRSENVMVVDLVRNDLSKICSKGSVEVEELFGIYSFPNVHQMISTVRGKINTDFPFGNILKAMFPMGSMTGAPKDSVMKLTEKYEFGKRGIYSGTVGYISPNKDFDFNVVIRSIVYNAEKEYISYHVGSAITTYSNPVDEYEECLLKGRAITALLEGISLDVPKIFEGK